MRRTLALTLSCLALLTCYWNESILVASTSPSLDSSNSSHTNEKSSKKKEKDNNNNNNIITNNKIRRTQNNIAESTIDASSPIIQVRGTFPNKENDHNKHKHQDELSTKSIIQSFFSSSTSFQDSHSIALLNKIHELANTPSIQFFLQSTRRNLHKHPELMYQESYTSHAIQSILDQLHIPHTSGWGKNIHPDVFKGEGGYGIVADIGTGSSPCIILRADMDALPIQEQTEMIDSFKSNYNGRMHACGHDGHTTMLLGAAAILKDMEASIPGTIRIMFQPAEEGGAGAKRMIEEGVIDMEPRAQMAFAMHVQPSLPSGAIGSRSGPIQAAADMFEILIAGKGGHAATPHLTIDPIVTASSIVMNLQTIISRSISPLEAGVVSITQFTSGESFNVIPASALLRGTIRALSLEELLYLKDKVQHIVNTTAFVHGCNATVTFMPDFYPPVINDPELYENFSKHVGALVSNEDYVHETLTTGAEDFAFLTQVIPSTFFWIGQGSGGSDERHVPPTNFGLHHPNFALDENILPQGVELHVNLALRSLKKLHSDTSNKEGYLIQ